MEELDSLERQDRQRRQEAVASIPVILLKRVLILFFMSFYVSLLVLTTKPLIFAWQMQKYCHFLASSSEVALHTLHTADFVLKISQVKMSYTQPNFHQI